MKRAFVVFLVLLACSCTKPEAGSPEAAFAKAVEAVERSDVDGLEQLMAPDFTGEADRATTLAYARQWLSRPQHPKVRVSVLNQQKSEDARGVTLRSQVLVSSGGGLFPERSSRFQVDTQWGKFDGQWKIRVAQWHSLH